MKKIYLLILPLLFLPLIVNASDAFPSFPMAFYGQVKYDGQVLSVGSKVRAYCNSDLKGEVIVQGSGAYGYSDPTKTKLVIGSYSGCNKLVFKFISTGSTTENGGDSVISYNSGFVSGSTIDLDLNFTKNVPPVIPPSTGGGGGGGGGNITPPAAPIIGDSDGNGKVDIIDFALMMSNWGKNGINVSDLNNDSKVDIIDFALLMAHWSIN